MTTTALRPNGCLPPLRLDDVVADPESVRSIARGNGPYFMPGRYLVDGGPAAAAGDGVRRRERDVPSYLVGPVWRGDWCVGGEALVPEAAPLLHHEPFVAAARRMYDADVVVPEQVYVNLSGPMSGQPFSHTDIPEFVGLDRTNAPGWFLQAMGTSGLFESHRITICTAVAWFHHGPRGYFRYWPDGRDADSVRHENMWNTAVVGDNDFMHHKVERVGAPDAERCPGLTIDTLLDHDGDHWLVIDDGTVLARYGDADIRMSLSWKAKVYADADTRAAADRGDNAITIDEALERFDAALDGGLAATSVDDPALRDQLSGRWSGYVAG